MEELRSIGAISCNSGDGTDQRVQSLMFMMMMMMMMMINTFLVGSAVFIVVILENVSSKNEPYPEKY